MCKPTSSTQLDAFFFVDSRWHEPHDAVQCRATVHSCYQPGDGFFFFSMAQHPNLGLGRHTVGVYRSHTDAHTHPQTHTHTHTQNLQDSPERVISLSQRPLPTQHTRVTNIHAPSRIRTRNPSSQAAADLRLRPHGYQDRPGNGLTQPKHVDEWEFK